MAGDLLRFVVQFPEGELTLLPKRAPLGNSAPISGAGRAGIGQHRVGRGQGATPGRCAGIAHVDLPGKQPAIAVIDLTEDAAMSLGRTLGLGEILFWDGRRGRMVACR